jgi:hypothetical protein
MSIERVVQAVGRATFAGADTLRANGFDAVTYLGPRADFESAVAYPRLLCAVSDAVSDGRDPATRLVGPGPDEPAAAWDGFRYLLQACSATSLGLRPPPTPITKVFAHAPPHQPRNTHTLAGGPARPNRFPHWANIQPVGQARRVGNPDYSFAILPDAFEPAPARRNSPAAEGGGDDGSSSDNEGDGGGDGGGDEAVEGEGGGVEGKGGTDEALVAALRRLAASGQARGAPPLDAKEPTKAAWLKHGRRRQLDSGLSAAEVAAALAEQATEDRSAGPTWGLAVVERTLDALHRRNDGGVRRVQSGGGYVYMLSGLAVGGAEEEEEEEEENAGEEVSGLAGCTAKGGHYGRCKVARAGEDAMDLCCGGAGTAPATIPGVETVAAAPQVHPNETQSDHCLLKSIPLNKGKQMYCYDLY